MTNYIQDVIWANQQTCTYHFHEKSITSRKHALPRVKFYRAEPVRELLKSIRDQVEFCKKHDSTPALDKTMELIDNFLENNTK